MDKVVLGTHGQRVKIDRLFSAPPLAVFSTSPEALEDTGLVVVRRVTRRSAYTSLLDSCWPALRASSARTGALEALQEAL
jgi:hypothetical protein